VSPVFEDPQAFYMMELVSGTPDSVQPLETARPTIERSLRLEKKIAMAEAEARDLVEQARAAGTLEVLNGVDGITVQEAGPNSRSEFFPGLGYQNQAIGVAFGLAVDEISNPVAANSNVFLIQTLEKIPADSAAWEEQKELQRAQSVFTVQRQRLDQWILALRETADIVDRRDQVLQTPRGQAAPTGGLF
jgi:hypothetical protein